MVLLLMKDIPHWASGPQKIKLCSTLPQQVQRSYLCQNLL